MGARRFCFTSPKNASTHGEDFKYLGNYLEIFELLKKFAPAYQVESIKLFKLILFNYFISNGDAHFKNFSLIETPLGDFKLSPAYDLLNSRIHIDDKDFALKDGLLPLNKAQVSIKSQFYTLGTLSGISEKQIEKVFLGLTSNKYKIERLINASFLNDKIKRNYLQAYQTKLKELTEN